MPGADVSAESWTGVDCNVVDEFVQFCHQGMQPYVNVEGYHDTPYMSVHESGALGIDLGVDVGFSSAVEPRVMSTPGAQQSRAWVQKMLTMRPGLGRTIGTAEA